MSSNRIETSVADTRILSGLYKLHNFFFLMNKRPTFSLVPPLFFFFLYVTPGFTSLHNHHK